LNNGTPGDVPTATVVKDGKVPGDVPRPEAPMRKPHRRKLSNYLLDKKLQLRYVIVVSALSAIIAGSLGWMIYQQEQRASDDLVAGLADLTDNDESLAEFQREVARDMHARDRSLILEMAGVGVGLVVVLFVYLVLMTHKVAGPLYKVSHHFDQLADGRIGRVTPLRKGDMLQDFFTSFREMHDAVRGRLASDATAMRRFVEVSRAAGLDTSSGLGEEIERLDRHVTERQKAMT
jgi:methyl-accepting chemotaxis protein